MFKICVIMNCFMNISDVVQVFVGKRPYDVAPFEDFLKKELSESTTMSDLPKRPRYCVVVVVYHVTIVAIGHGLLKKFWPLLLGCVLRTAGSKIIIIIVCP